MCNMIGQFSRLYFTVWPAKFKSLFNLVSSPLFESRGRINIVLVLFSWSLLKVTEPCFLPLGFMVCMHCLWAINAR